MRKKGDDTELFVVACLVQALIVYEFNDFWYWHVFGHLFHGPGNNIFGGTTTIIILGWTRFYASREVLNCREALNLKFGCKTTRVTFILECLILSRVKFAKSRQAAYRIALGKILKDSCINSAKFHSTLQLLSCFLPFWFQIFACQNKVELI